MKSDSKTIRAELRIDLEVLDRLMWGSVSKIWGSGHDGNLWVSKYWRTQVLFSRTKTRHSHWETANQYERLCNLFEWSVSKIWAGSSCAFLCPLIITSLLPSRNWSVRTKTLSLSHTLSLLWPTREWVKWREHVCCIPNPLSLSDDALPCRCRTRSDRSLALYFITYGLFVRKS